MGNNNKGKDECHLKKRKIIEHVNDDELVLSSSGVVLEVNERGNYFYNIMKYLLEQMYKHTFHLQ